MVAIGELGRPPLGKTEADMKPQPDEKKGPAVEDLEKGNVSDAVYQTTVEANPLTPQTKTNGREPTMGRPLIKISVMLCIVLLLLLMLFFFFLPFFGALWHEGRWQAVRMYLAEVFKELVNRFSGNRSPTTEKS